MVNTGNSNNQQYESLKKKIDSKIDHFYLTEFLKNHEWKAKSFMDKSDEIEINYKKRWYYYNLVKVMFCAIWYHLYNLKKVKNTYGGVLMLV